MHRLGGNCSGGNSVASIMTDFRSNVASPGGSNGAVDNDDESLRYDNNHNFQICTQPSPNPHLILT